MSKVHLGLLTKKFALLGLAVAVLTPQVALPAKVLANELAASPEVTAPATTITAGSVQTLQLKTPHMLFINNGKQYVRADETAPLASGDYRLQIGLVTFFDVEQSWVKLNFDGKRLKADFSVRTPEDELISESSQHDLMPATELSLEMSDVVHVTKVTKSGAMEALGDISAEAFTDEAGFDLGATLTNRREMVILSVDFWVGPT